MDRHPSGLDQRLGEFVNPRPRVAVERMGRILPLSPMNLLGVLDRHRDARSKLLEAVDVFFVVVDMLSEALPDGRVTGETAATALKMEEKPVFEARVRPRQLQAIVLGGLCFSIPDASITTLFCVEHAPDFIEWYKSVADLG
ncbi:MAG TPA: hypothetical protein VJY33_11805, partial [Isosphaeraceae bacterium]|nr:hypothetical protein [Isosphaeraceae bacterium]